MKKRFGAVTKEDKTRINEQIHSEQVRVIDELGNPVGIITSKEALAMAQGKHLDLVEIAPKAAPPVCKIIDYGKYRYKQTKREKENKKKQHIVSVKTIRIMSVNIDSNDLELKAKNARKFLEEGNKVKVFLQFRGREIVHKERGIKLLREFYGFVEDIAKLDGTISAEGARRVMMILNKK